jgi:hypothetical protein
MSTLPNLTYEQIDLIVVNELKEAYKINAECTYQDSELLDAIELLLGYFMPVRDFNDWSQNQILEILKKP